MGEPVETPESGTGETASTETAENTPITETSADDSAAGDTDDSGETAGGATETAGTQIPYDRFKKVNEQRKAAEAKAAELQARIDELTPKPKVEAKDKLKRSLKQAPADMTPLEQMEFYGLSTLEEHPEVLDAWFERKFGMSPEAAAATLAHTTTTSRATILGQFEKACNDRGLDPRNPSVQEAVGRLMDSKKFNSFGEAMDVFVKPKTNGTVAPRKVGKGAESESVAVEGLSRVRILPRTAQEAHALAAKGQAIEHESVTNVLAAFDKR